MRATEYPNHHDQNRPSRMAQLMPRPSVDDNKNRRRAPRKLRELRDKAVAYPNDFRPTHHAEESAIEQYEHADKEALEANPPPKSRSLAA